MSERMTDRDRNAVNGLLQERLRTRLPGFDVEFDESELVIQKRSAPLVSFAKEVSFSYSKLGGFFSNSLEGIVDDLDELIDRVRDTADEAHSVLTAIGVEPGTLVARIQELNARAIRAQESEKIIRSIHESIVKLASASMGEV